jgi:hypothetical protein
MDAIRFISQLDQRKLSNMAHTIFGVHTGIALRNEVEWDAALGR